MPTTPHAINANTSTSVQVAGANSNRNSLYIRNYASGVVNPGQGTMWVAFGVPATVGTNGEMEILPGGEYSWGSGLLPNNTTPLKGYPLESVNIISSGGAAVGCCVET
jgi:hypothetical protein